MPLIDPELYALTDEVREANREQALLVREFQSSLDPDPATYLQSVRGIMDDPAGLFYQERVPEAHDRTIPGPGGELTVRIMVPERYSAVLLNFHGGGWMMGSRSSQDQENWHMARTCGVVVISPDYRLAPEHTYPAANDDCEAAALWVLDSALSEFGVDRLIIGGGSAGAHLAACTLLRLRDRHGAAGAVTGMVLDAGVYDAAGTPSVRGELPEHSTLSVAPLLDLYFGDRTPAELRDPDLSPLYGDLRGLCPALFSVGTADPLLDDSLFMAARWEAAGNRTELAVYPYGPHCVALSPTEMGRRARARIDSFLRECAGS